MKKLILAFILTGMYANTNATTTERLAEIYDNILLENSKRSVQSCETLAQVLGSDAVSTADVITPYQDLVATWKAVEVTYILGSVDIDAIDYPLFIDMYHMGNEDINRALTRALDGNSTAETALYKNSYRTINALEKLLFDSPWNERQLDLAQYATDSLCNRLSQVQHSYQVHRDAALADHDQIIAYLLNGLVESTYKTREWRVGEASGLSRKYSGDPDPQRVEYPFSHNSLLAIKAILDTHVQMIGEDQQPNFATFAREQGADEAIALAQQALADALTAYEQIPSDTDFSVEDVEPLFEALNALQIAYYQNLLQSLDVVAKILEADGD